MSLYGGGQTRAIVEGKGVPPKGRKRNGLAVAPPSPTNAGPTGSGPEQQLAVETVDG